MKVTHEHTTPGGSRYEYDFGPCTPDKGWAQIDTGQDAAYFGQWINPAELQVLTYIEGEVRLVEAETPAELVEYMRNLVRWNEEHGFTQPKIDPGFSDTLADAIREIGLGDMIH